MTSIKNIAHLGKAAQAAHKLADMAETLAASSHPLHKANVDLLRINALMLYDEILMLKPDVAEEHQTPEQIANAAESTPEAQELQVAGSAHFAAAEKIEVPAPKNIEEADEKHSSYKAPDSQVASQKNVAQQNTVREKKTANNILPDLFSESTIPIADRLAAQPDNSLAARLEKRPITELRKVIGINDKFLFINELFEGNIQIYNHAIDELDGFRSYNGAKTYLIELSVLHGWDPDSTAAKKLHELIDRKFENL
jgi:hypothetical protein